MALMFATLCAAAGIALLTGGSLRRLLATPLRATAVLFCALALQVGLELVRPGRGSVTDIAHALLVVSYAFLLVFCMANVRLTGMTVVAVGVALNAAVITVDQGMPVRAASAGAATVKHHLERSSDELMPLADIIVVHPLRRAVSFGDVILLVGLVGVLVHRSRGPARRTGRSAAPEPGGGRRARAPAPDGALAATGR